MNMLSHAIWRDNCNYFTSTYKDLGIHQRSRHEDLSPTPDHSYCKIFESSFENKNSYVIWSLKLKVNSIMYSQAVHPSNLIYPHWDRDKYTGEEIETFPAHKSEVKKLFPQSNIHLIIVYPIRLSQVLLLGRLFNEGNNFQSIWERFL